MIPTGAIEESTENIPRVHQPMFSKSFTTKLPNTLEIIHLQMNDWSEFRPAYLNYPEGIKVMCMDTPDVAFYRFLYSSIGKQWRWRSRLSQSDQEIEDILSIPGTSVHVLYVAGVPAGYIELAKHMEGHSSRFYSIEIVYFGLRPGYIGRGFGKHLLSHGIAYAWNKGTQRIWVCTSNLDSPHALKNYINRGFKIHRVEQQPMPNNSL